MARAKSHRDVEFEVEPVSRGEHDMYRKRFKSFAAAERYAKSLTGDFDRVRIDVLVWSAAGARWAGLEEDYAADPEASAHARIEYREGHEPNYMGRVA